MAKRQGVEVQDVAQSGENYEKKIGSTYSRLETKAEFTMYWIAVRADSKSCPVKYEHLSDMWLSTLEIGAAQLRFVTEIAPKSALLCVNRIPIRCGIPVAAKAISYSVNIAQMC